MLKLLQHEIRSRAPGIVGWGLGLSILPIMYVGLYPQFADELANMQNLMDIALYQALGISMASFEGYVASTVTNLAPVILAIYAVISGTGMLAGEEDDGRLEMIVALPIPRWQIVTVKAIALGIALLLILTIVGAAAALTMAGIAGQVETTVTPLRVFGELMASWPLEMTFAMASLFLGAFSPSRRTAALLAMVVVLVSYFGNNLTNMFPSMEGLRALFPFHYYQATADALIHGQKPVDLLILTAVALALFALALIFFQRRDITVGVWPWQRGRARAGGTGGTGGTGGA
jgi:ABC-2 type transport system permease protein